MAENATGASQAEDLVAQVDTGARSPTNWQGSFILVMCFVWAAYQIFIASNLPFTLGILTGSNFFIIIKSEARFVHLAFAIFLAAMAFPLFKSSPRRYIPWYDWLLGLTGVACCLYLLVFMNLSRFAPACRQQRTWSPPPSV